VMMITGDNLGELLREAFERVDVVRRCYWTRGLWYVYL